MVGGADFEKRIPNGVVRSQPRTRERNLMLGHSLSQGASGRSTHAVVRRTELKNRIGNDRGRTRTIKTHRCRRLDRPFPADSQNCGIAQGRYAQVIDRPILSRGGRVAPSWRAFNRYLSDPREHLLEPPRNLVLTAHRTRLIDRVLKGALKHRTDQIDIDGCQKLPQPLLAIIRGREERGARIKVEDPEGYPGGNLLA